jgi:hypothetical protein
MARGLYSSSSTKLFEAEPESLEEIGVKRRLIATDSSSDGAVA